MKIKTTFTEQREVNIIVPLFLKSDYRYYAVLDEKTEVTIFITDTTTSVRNSIPDHNDIARNITEMEDCREDEFMEALDKAIQTLSLKPILHDTIC